jgi:hypothetical protein
MKPATLISLEPYIAVIPCATRGNEFTAVMPIEIKFNCKPDQALWCWLLTLLTHDLHLN